MDTIVCMKALPERIQRVFATCARGSQLIMWFPRQCGAISVSNCYRCIVVSRNRCFGNMAREIVDVAAQLGFFRVITPWQDAPACANQLLITQLMQQANHPETACRHCSKITMPDATTTIYCRSACMKKETATQTTAATAPSANI